MTFKTLDLEGVYLIENFNSIDDRGLFVKTFHKNEFCKMGLNFEIRESYYSNNKKDVIRGMHFQMPPHDHEKLVYVTSGSIKDVVIDLRKESPTYCNYIDIELSAENKNSIFIPKGMAHGFNSLEDDTTTIYNVATEYSPENDSGIRFDSFGYDWEVTKPIASSRDKSFLTLDKFSSPF